MLYFLHVNNKFLKKTDMMNKMSGQKGGEMGHTCLPSFRPHIRLNRPWWDQCSQFGTMTHSFASGIVRSGPGIDDDVVGDFDDGNVDDDDYEINNFGGTEFFFRAAIRIPSFLGSVGGRQLSP